MRLLEEEYRGLAAQLKELRLEMDVTVKNAVESVKSNQSAPSGDKVNYLQEVNEQMFQQNVRLRELIEICIQEQVVPTQEEYYLALKEEN